MIHFVVLQKMPNKWNAGISYRFEIVSHVSLPLFYFGRYMVSHVSFSWEIFCFSPLAQIDLFRCVPLLQSYLVVFA